VLPTLTLLSAVVLPAWLKPVADTSMRESNRYARDTGNFRLRRISDGAVAELGRLLGRKTCWVAADGDWDM